MITVNTLPERNAIQNAIAYYCNSDGTWAVYQTGDTLPVVTPSTNSSVPDSISNYQARMALAHANLLAVVETYIGNLPVYATARLAWNYKDSIAF